MKSAVHAPGFEDLAAGETWRTYRRTVTEADLVGFTQLAGLKLPIFVDEDWARRESPYGGRIVPGFLICTFSAGMLESVLGANTLAGLSMDAFRFIAPVRPGDTLACEVTVESAKEASDGKRGVLSLAVKVVNQMDAAVLEYKTRVLMKKRLSTGPARDR
jgi:acyl dehydratase